MSVKIPPSPWSEVPRQPNVPQAQAQAPAITPDMLYPSFPNPAGLGNMMGYDIPPAEVPVPAMIQPQPLPYDPAGVLNEPQMTMPEMNPWSMMNGTG